MGSLFFTQFAALLWKNWIILSKHKLLNSMRCILLPICFGVFLAAAQVFLQKPNNYGIGAPVPIYDFTAQFDGSLALIWADGTNGTGNPSADDIMQHITRGFNGDQLTAIKQVTSPADIPSNCQQNFQSLSNCFSGIAFNYLPVSLTDTTPINYTISADGGLGYVDVYSHTSDFETRILPLQLAIDEAFISLRTGKSILTPLEWPYAQETNEEQFMYLRLSYVTGIKDLIAIALFVCYIGIAYHLPGAFVGERANLLTSHMKAMGLLDSARIISWHVSISLAYLPAWIIIALIWHYYIFTKTDVGLILVVHLLLGLSLASWSFLVAAPFGRSPQLAAMMSTFLAILLATLAQVFSHASTTVAVIFTLVFPPGYYIFAIRAICGYESSLIPTDLLRPDPDSHLTLLPIMMACVINIFWWPCLGALLEWRIYDSREPSDGFFNMRKQEEFPLHPPGIAISIRNLSKTFTPSMFGCGKGQITAIFDLSLDIPKTGIFVLLGSNGAGKSTSLSIMANLVGRSSGSITFEGGEKHPPRGTLGIVPQKNVLFPDLTCYQTLQIWHAIKYSSDSVSDDNDYERLLRDCDLGKKIHSNANMLSGGQKRKLQLAIGLLGGSKIVLVDECTSGVDPLSRRELWRTLTSVKHERTIVYTTHFLDEADLLADHIAILTAPGKLVAQGSPVALKRNLGQGYSIQVTFDPSMMNEEDPSRSLFEVLEHVKVVASECTLSRSSPTRAAYHLNSKDSIIVEKVLRLLDNEAEEHHIISVDVLGTTIENIFLDLMESEVQPHIRNVAAEKSIESADGASIPNVLDPLGELPVPVPLALTDGRAQSPFGQALTIFYKRMLIARRNWFTPALCILIAVCGTCVPLVFLSGQNLSCSIELTTETLTPLYWPYFPEAIGYTPNISILESPPNITATLGQSGMSVLTESVPDNASFVSVIQRDYLNIPIGGISIDVQAGNSLIAWDASLSPGLAGPALLNLVTNILYQRALNTSGNTADTSNIIVANYANFPPIPQTLLQNIKWVGFFGAAMAIYPAFFSLYVSRERQSSVQAMQFSNGLSDPIGLWLGHLLWDSVFAVIIATVIIVVYGAVSNQFYGLGLFWFVLVQYGIVGALFSYCVSLFMSSPLTSFAAVAGYQTIMHALHLAGYLLILTYVKTTMASKIIKIFNFTFSILSPIASVLRSAFISINLFSLLCDGSSPVTPSMGGFMQDGGPILYLFADGLVLFGILLWAHSGSIKLRFLNVRKQQKQYDDPAASSKTSREDVTREAKATAQSSDSLRVLRVAKSYDSNRVIDDVTFGVPENVIFAMLGPNGAGKTTMFNMIRGDVTPNAGDIMIKGVSVVNHPRTARLALGVCPQFTAVDTQLTVREHLFIYGRLKGLRPGPELNSNVKTLLDATSLLMYADRLASELSGGNQRKMSLAIALMGNPSVVLIDEFSTGIDAKTKRDMWGTLRHVAAGKAVVITTHSMEEVSALANKVGILSKRLLAVGTADELAGRYATYQVQFSCATREEVMRAQVLMSRIPGARLVEDIATRFEVPIRQASSMAGDVGNMSLAHLFHVLSTQGDFEEYTVEKATLESVFLDVIRQNRASEQGGRP